MAKNIHFNLPTDVHFGEDVLNHIGATAAKHGERALLVSEAVLHDGEHIERVQDMLIKRSMDCILFDEVMPGSTSSVVEELVELARASQAQLVIGLGGMRVLTAARLTAMIAPGNTSVASVLSGVVPKTTPLPYVEMPSSYRNHFMLIDRCVVTEESTRNARIIQTTPGLVTNVLVDPVLTMTMSHKYAATAIMDTLLASVEGYVSRRANPMSDALLIQAISVLNEAALGMAKNADDMGCRSRASEGGLLCAFGLAMSSQGLGGALAYTINSRYNVPKSWVATALLPHVLDFYVSTRADKLSAIATAMGEEISGLASSSSALRSSSAARKLMARLALPSRLRDFDLSLDDLVEVSEVAAGFDMVRSVPVPLGAQDIYEVVKQAY